MGLFANWKALVSGFPSVLDWNRYTKAIALMRGQNGVRVFLQNGGAVIEGDNSSGDTDHPFTFTDISTEDVPFTFTISPGQFIARGAAGPNYMFPEVGSAGSGIYLSDIPAPTFNVATGKDAYVVLQAIYTVSGGVAVWDSSVIKKVEVAEDAPLTGVDNDYLNGHLVLFCVRRALTGYGLSVQNTYVRSNVMHMKSNTFHHFWTVA